MSPLAHFKPAIRASRSIGQSRLGTVILCAMPERPIKLKKPSWFAPNPSSVLQVYPDRQAPPPPAQPHLL